MSEAEGRKALLRQEAIAAIVMNALMSIGFFFLVFGWHPATAHDLGIDFLPQSFGVTFLGTLIPSLLTYGRLTRGKVVAAGPVPTKGRQLLRIVIAASFAIVAFGGTAALLMIMFAPATMAPLPALVLKTIYGAALGRIMTPPMIRSVLGMPIFARTQTPMAEVA